MVIKAKRQGRGSTHRVDNPFENQTYRPENEYLNWQLANGENPLADEATQWISVEAKSIVNAVHSPDIGHKWSLNPYQGCEHGCSYCYARNSHSYWAMDAGLDFERKILVKENAAALLAKQFEKKSWQAAPIMLSGNTDCYQPLERQLRISRQCLEVFLAYGNPVGIITKNALIERDVDILKKLAQKKLLQVAFSINTLNEDLRRQMEPRTASIKKRLAAVRNLSESGIPVKVMIAPIIPGLNSHEVLAIAKEAHEAGAIDINYTMLRLNGQLTELFKSWLQSCYPDRLAKVLKLVAETHGGNLNDSQFGRRMHGNGAIAEQVKQSVALARRKYFKNRAEHHYDLSQFQRIQKGQFRLFD